MSTIEATPAVTRSAAGWAGLALIGAAACWGGATVLTKGALDLWPPFTLLGLQLTSSVLFLWTVVFLRREMGWASRDALRGAAVGFLEPGLAYAAVTPGLAMTSATSAAVLGAAEPALIILIAWGLFGDRPSPRLLAALGISALGVTLVSLSEEAGGAHRLAGDALILVGVLLAALYVVLSGRLVRNIAPLPLCALQQSAGLVIALAAMALSLGLGIEHWPERITPTMVVLAIVTGIVQYAGSFWLYLIGLKYYPAGAAGQFLALIPVFGIAGAMSFLGETPSTLQLVGSLAVIAAVTLIARRMKTD